MLRHCGVPFALLSALVFAPLAAGAESLPGHTVLIDDAALSPADASFPGDSDFQLRNRSTSHVRIQFDLPRGEGVTCGTGSDPARYARKFVVEKGDALRCTPDRNEYRFEVYRAVRLASGAFEHRRSEGRVELR